MTDEDVRDMLAERARAIRPSADGLSKIEARLASAPATARRRLPMPMVAAAAVTVLALVGVTVFVQRDDETSVDSGSFTAAPTEPAGVWPWPGDTVVPGVQDDPVETARAYVESAVPEAGELTDTGFNQPGVGSGAVTFTGAVSTTVYVQEGDDGWYVTGASSDLVTATIDEEWLIEYETTAPGELTKTVQEPGEPARPLGPMVETQRGDGVGDRYALSTPMPVSRHRFVLRTDDGVTGLAELRYERPDDEEETTDTTMPETATLPPGVWPFPHDDLDGVLLDDPVETARAYVGARVGGITDRTTVSEYQAGDSNSGEVVFGGDIQTTVFVRRLDGWWHVEGSASDLVTLHDADGDGALTAVVEAKGWLQSHVTLSSGSTEPLVPAREFEAGEEITEGLAYDLNTDRVVKAVRFLLTFGPEGVKGLSEVAFRPPFAETPAPDDAVWSEAGLDARELVVAYLDDRLAGRAVDVGQLTDLGDGRGEVTWEAGVVRLRQVDGSWYVTEAIGDSIQIKGTSLDVGYVGGTLTLAEAGTVHLSVGDVTWDVRNDVDAEGTDVPLEHEVPTDSPVVLRAVFETDAGFVSLAERVIG